MYILKHVLPLVVISLLFGFFIARLDVASLFDSPGADTQGQNPATSEEDASGWSVDRFVNNLRERQGAVAVDAPVERDVEAQLSSAADRAESRSADDPYLSSILEEASGLSVTATPAAEDGVRRYPPGAAGTRVVIVAEGESLTDIADRVYGDPNAYPRIFDANRDVLSNPDQIFAGQRLRIPE